MLARAQPHIWAKIGVVGQFFGMKYTQAQLLDLTGITLDRLRHWRKEIPGLDARAGRRGTLSFEDVALVAVLSRAVDVLGLALSVFAPHYDHILAALQQSTDIKNTNLVLWLNGSAAEVGGESPSLGGEVLTMIRFAPIISKLFEDVERTGDKQLRLNLYGGAARSTTKLLL